MAGSHGSDLAGVAQALLLDDPDFLRGIVERALHAILEEEMTAPPRAGTRRQRGRRTEGSRLEDFYRTSRT